MSYVIRKAVLSDLGPALQLDREAFGVDAWTFLDYMGVFSIRSVKNFTAEEDGQFAGFASIEFDHQKKAACLMTLAVQPEFRNRLSRIVTFNGMDEMMAKQIVEKKLGELREEAGCPEPSGTLAGLWRAGKGAQSFPPDPAPYSPCAC